jgi:hypothetical protein
LLVGCGSSDAPATGVGGTVAQPVEDAATIDHAANAEARRAAARTYARDDIACTKDSDCCAVHDPCLVQWYIVGVADKDTVASILGEADWLAGCSPCSTPDVEVSCGPAGFCVGQELCEGYYALGNHCGRVNVAGVCTLAPQNLSAPPGRHLELMLGCGI